VLEEADFIRRRPHESIHSVLIGEEVGPFHGIPGVQLEAVSFLGAHHRLDANLHCGAQPGQSRSQDEDIMSYLLHASGAP
jgi:hypothetical protein